MSDTKFTPGKWKAEISNRKDYTSVIIHLPDGGFCIGQIPDAEANAYLIAESPDLYKALEEMCDMWTTVCDAQGWEPEHVVQYKNAVNSLARARGDSHE